MQSSAEGHSAALWPHRGATGTRHTIKRPPQTRRALGIIKLWEGGGPPGYACAKTFVPTIPTTVSAMKQAWIPLTLSPKRRTPPMMTPIAPAPVQMA